MAIDETLNWMTPIWAFLTNGALLQDKVQARQIQARATRHAIIEKKLYKHGYSLPLLLCVTQEKRVKALQEIHEGICSDHAAAHSMAYKVVR